MDRESIKGQRISIEPHVLERLLFDIEIQGERIVKLPVWSGDFLEYIDLSEVSFSDVLWDGEKVENGIVYKNTNAKIDFRTAAVIKDCKSFNKTGCDVLYSMRYCDFSGTDLSENYMEDIHGISHCNLENTFFGETFTDADFTQCSFLLQCGRIDSTSFVGLSFDDLKLPLLSAVRSICDFADSGVKFYSRNMQFAREEEQKEFEQEFSKMLNSDMLKNCYVDQFGLILSKSTVSNTLLSIENQVLKINKKDY